LTPDTFPPPSAEHEECAVSETAVECSILRGGTSRGVFFRKESLPDDKAAVENFLLNVFGSPDMRQINGLGGATSQTSKAAIIGPPSRDDADVDYTFAQVSVGTPIVDWGGNCGNISSAVGPYAIDSGLVQATDGLTPVRIHNTNTSQIIIAQVPTRNGRAVIEGDYAIPGVPGTGAQINLEFTEPAGSVTGRLLPTGKARETVTLASGREVTVSVVDASNPTVFLLAEELGMTGIETPLEIEANTELTDLLEEARSIIAEQIGIVDDRSVATASSPGLPKVGFVAPPRDHATLTGERVAAGSIDLIGRVMSMQTAHRAYQATAAICTAAAAFVEGSVVHEVTRAERPDPGTIRLAHPYGIMEMSVRTDANADELHITGITIGRTARHILDGAVWVPSDLVASVRRPAAVVTA
jgi:2-methylaconitate cis-trans-isomerase PrpF